MSEWERVLGDASAVQLVLWLAAVVALVVALVKAWPIIRRFVRTIDALSDLPETLDRITRQVENSHSTILRDDLTDALEAVKRMEDQIAGLAEWQTKHEKKSDATVARIDALERKEPS